MNPEYEPQDGRALIELGTEGVTPADVVAVARGGVAVRLSEQALQSMARSRRFVEVLGAGPQPTYGVSTGFGALATRQIAPTQRAQLQQSLVRSHAASMGRVIDEEITRGMMFLRLKTLATGHTGARPLVAETMAALLNAGVTPVVREHGSLGCSGDLAPLAHCALTLIGEGEVLGHDGQPTASGPVLRAAGILPLILEAKEGLSLVNGTDGMLAMLLLACEDLKHLCVVADIAAALSVEGLLGTDQAFLPGLQHNLRPHPGQTVSASNLLKLLQGSAIVASHRTSDTQVQDAYSLRCAPQVAGAVRDTLEHARTVASRELRSAIDNPVVLADGTVASNGNFHGAPLGYVLDFLAICVADLSSISERRTDRLLDPARSRGLPAFLADDPGVDSGLMIAQYTQAAMVSENKRLAVPASVDSIPSSAMQEDHVSMGWSAGIKLRTALTNLRRVLAIELVAGARAVEMRSPLQPGPATAAAIAELRREVPGPGPDRWLSPELENADRLIASGRIVAAVTCVVDLH
jgi:histidine ammonia-lyase